MRGSSIQSGFGPPPAYSLRETIVGTAVLAAVVGFVLVAVSYPSAAVGVAALGLAGRSLVRELGTIRNRRRREGRTRAVCLPVVGVCLEG